MRVAVPTPLPPIPTPGLRSADVSGHGSAPTAPGSAQPPGTWPRGAGHHSQLRRGSRAETPARVSLGGSRREARGGGRQGGRGWHSGPGGRGLPVGGATVLGTGPVGCWASTPHALLRQDPRGRPAAKSRSVWTLEGARQAGAGGGRRGARAGGWSGQEGGQGWGLERAGGGPGCRPLSWGLEGACEAWV